MTPCNGGKTGVEVARGAEVLVGGTTTVFVGTTTIGVAVIMMLVGGTTTMVVGNGVAVAAVVGIAIVGGTVAVGAEASAVAVRDGLVGLHGSGSFPSRIPSLSESGTSGRGQV